MLLTKIIGSLAIGSLAIGTGTFITLVGDTHPLYKLFLVIVVLIIAALAFVTIWTEEE